MTCITGSLLSSLAIFLSSFATNLTSLIIRYMYSRCQKTGSVWKLNFIFIFHLTSDLSFNVVINIIYNSLLGFEECVNHKRRIYTTEKAKVVAASWGTELPQFLATLAILHQNRLKNMLIFTLSFNLAWCKSACSSNHPGEKKASAARNLNNSGPQEAATTFSFV